jgi:hypothetical protein
MQPAKTPPLKETITIAERVLSTSLGGTVRLGAGAFTLAHAIHP